MKYFENSTLFKYSWEQVSQGLWQRYPNPESSHVLSEDTLSRSVIDGKLYTKRMLTKTNRVPKWGEKFVPHSTVKIIEESIVDPKNKTVVTYTRNIGLQRVMSIVEKVTYTPSEENVSWTVAQRSAWVDSQVLGFSGAIKAFGIERFKKNCNRMAKGFEYVLSHLFPHTAVQNARESASTPLSKAEKIKGAAKKATDLAKSQANTIIFASCEANSK